MNCRQLGVSTLTLAVSLFNRITKLRRITQTKHATSKGEVHTMFLVAKRRSEATWKTQAQTEDY